MRAPLDCRAKNAANATCWKPACALGSVSECCQARHRTDSRCAAVGSPHRGASKRQRITAWRRVVPLRRAGGPRCGRPRCVAATRERPESRSTVPARVRIARLRPRSQVKSEVRKDTCRCVCSDRATSYVTRSSARAHTLDVQGFHRAAMSGSSADTDRHALQHADTLCDARCSQRRRRRESSAKPGCFPRIR
jgi:hypothetical protein